MEKSLRWARLGGLEAEVEAVSKIFIFERDAAMKRRLFGFLTLCMIATVFTGCLGMRKSDPYGLAGKTHSAVTPSSDRLKYEWWNNRHQKILNTIASGDFDLIYVGDSITHGFEGAGKEMWAKYYAPRNALNMGFSGDRTQQVLWRFDHGEIDGISPKLAILMIGTNNSNGQDNTAEEIADGIKAICAKMREKLPKTKILMLAIFPRGEGTSPQREKNARASELASQIADGRHIFYLDINKAFLDEDGILSRGIMPDLVHPNENGYKIWAEAIEPTVKNLMGEK
jgi:lysophospholipase L1-like esterase